MPGVVIPPTLACAGASCCPEPAQANPSCLVVGNLSCIRMRSRRPPGRVWGGGGMGWGTEVHGRFTSDPPLTLPPPTQVGNLNCIRVNNRYVMSQYGVLMQQTVTSVDVEAFYQVRPPPPC